MSNLAPIALFTYNRPWHTQQTVEALQKNKLASESELFIYSDDAKNDDARVSVDEVRKYIDNITGFKKITVIKRDKNWGLANSIIDGVTKIVSEYGRIIVLEDDLVTSPYFLKFMNDSLEVYEKRNDIFSVTGFNYPKSILNIPDNYKDDIYLSYRCMSWTWATWKDRWNKVDWDVKNFHSLKNDKKQMESFNKGGQDLFTMLKSQMEGNIDSWAVRFCYAHSVNSAFCVYPVKSLVNNEGFDGSGVHCGNDKGNRLQNKLASIKHVQLKFDIEINDEIVSDFYKISQRSIFQRVKNLIRRLV
jgi:hypothetical protein